MKLQRYMLKLLLYVALRSTLASAYPLDRSEDTFHSNINSYSTSGNANNGEVISIRITSSVAVERGKSKEQVAADRADNHYINMPSTRITGATDRVTSFTDEDIYRVSASERHSITALPPALAGANIEFIKQLRLKKEGKSIHSDEHIHPFQLALLRQTNETKDSVADSEVEASVESRVNVQPNANIHDIDDTVPRARSIQLSPYINNYQLRESKPIIANITGTPKLNSTRTKFDIMHAISKLPTVHVSEPAKVYSEPSKVYSEPAKVYGKPELFYSEPAKVYSEPAKVYGKPELFYSEPAKVYGEPAKIYSEPAKIYSEPAKIYSEPAKIYSEPAKFYSEPASLHLDGYSMPPKIDDKLEMTTIVIMKETQQLSLPSTEAPKKRAESYQQREHLPEENYEVEEAISVMSNGRTHGVQESTTDHTKVGYVVEGNDYRKYRVEERTSDGFIVGEYGVVSHNDGSLRGVRYTADGDTNPRLIYDALMKFLHLTK